MAKRKVMNTALDFLQQGRWKQALSSNQLSSNQPINPIRSDGSIMGGIPDTISNIRHGNMGYWDAIKSAHTDEAGKMAWGTVAGSYMGVSAAGRIAGGGGLYRDKRGNPNLIGIPFV